MCSSAKPKSVVPPRDARKLPFSNRCLTSCTYRPCSHHQRPSSNMQGRSLFPVMVQRETRGQCRIRIGPCIIACDVIAVVAVACVNTHVLRHHAACASGKTRAERGCPAASGVGRHRRQGVRKHCTQTLPAATHLNWRREQALCEGA